MARSKRMVQIELKEIKRLVKATIKSTMNLLKFQKSLEKELVKMKEKEKRKAEQLRRFCRYNRVMRKPASR